MSRILRACERRGLVPTAMAVIGLTQLGCPTVDLGEEPVAPGSCLQSRAYFEDVLWPEYLAPETEAQSCVAAAGCHRRSDGRSSLRFAVNPVDDATNYEVATRFINCGTEASSSLLTKPLSGVDAHGGGDLFTEDDEAVAVFLDWFSAN